MADRSVTVKLDADVDPFIKAMAKAEAAAKRLREGLGKGMPDPFEPWDDEQQDRKRRAPKEGDQTAGAFAKAFSRRLEAAFKSLPKAKLDADASDAQKRMQEIRASLQTLSGKQIGVDIDATSALSEMAALRMELDRLSTSAEIDVRADAGAALSQLQMLQREIDKLNDSPPIEPDVDTGQARAALEDLKRRMAELTGRRIGIDLDAGAAQAEIRAIERELQQLNAASPEIDIRVDSTTALAELRTLESQINSVSGKSARVKVDADVGGALAAIALVGAALASLPAVTSIAVGVGVLGSAFTAAGVGAAGFAAVAIPSLGRVNEALKQAESSAGGAGGAMKSAAAKAAEAASAALRLAQAQDRVADSAQAVKDAQRGVQDAMQGVRQAKEDAARASEDSAARQAQAAARIADAERSVQDAHRATQRAIEDLTRAREQAQERMEDLALATERGALSEERAQLSIRRAQAELARVNADPKASALDREDADLRLREAELALREIQERNGDLAKEREESDRKGVEGSDEVVAAKERILDAQRAEADAERALGEARAAASRAAIDGARDVADAHDRVADAQRKVADAQQAVIKAQRDHLRATQALKVEQLQQKAAMEQAGSAAGGAASKMAELSKRERELAKDIKEFQDAYVEWQRSLQPDVFPVIRSGMDLMTTGMKLSKPVIAGTSDAMNVFLKRVNTELQSEEWGDFFNTLAIEGPLAIDRLGLSAINITNGLRGVIEALLPHSTDLLDIVVRITDKFEKWGEGLGDSQEFKDFILYVQENGPKVADILGNVTEFVGKLFQAGAGAAPGVLDFLVVLSEKLAGMSPDQIQAIALGVGAVFAAAKLGATLKLGAFVLLAEVLSEMSPGQIQALALAIAGVVTAVKGYQTVTGVVGFFQGLSGSLDKAGKSADGAAGKLGGVTGLFKGGVIAATVAGAALAFDKISDSLQGLNPDIDKLAKGLDAIGKGGAPTVELMDQLQPKMNTITGHFESFTDTAARLASDNPLESIITDIGGFIDSVSGIQLDDGKQAIDNIDQALANMVASGNAQGAAEAFSTLAKQAQDAGVPVDKLKELFPQYASSMDGLPSTTGEVGHAIELLGGQVDGTQKALGDAKQKLDDWKSSLSDFNAQTDAAESVREMERAFKDTKTAIENANGKLELTPGLTGKQRDAVIQARDAFAGYLEKVQTSADAQQTLSGRTTEARDAVLKQLPALMELAGKNKDARDQVLELAKAYGISEDDAKKAANGGKDLLEVLAKLKSKDIRIGADTRPAQEAIDNFIKLNSGKRIPLAVYTKQSQLAAGAIMRYASGGINDGLVRMASGGRTSPPPHVQDQPTILYGEGRGSEAFIPYDPAFRQRAISLLSQVASDFGLQVYGQEATRQVSDMRTAIDGTGMLVSDGLSESLDVMTDVMGDAGTLTGAIDRVGEVGTSLVAGWTAGSETVAKSVADAGVKVGDITHGVTGMVSAATSDMTTKMGGSISDLSATVGQLALAIVGAREAAAKPQAQKAGKGGSGGDPADRGSSAGSVIPPGPPKPKNMVAGHYGTGGVVSTHGGESSLTNYSQVSVPQQMPAASAYTPAPASAPMGGSSGTWGPGGSGGSAPAVVVQEQHIYQDADADRFAAQAAMRVRGRGR